MSRLLAALLVAVALAPFALAQDSGAHVTLDLAVQPDHTEKMTMTMEGLKRLTQYQGICLPARAVESRVYDEVGDLQYEAKEEDGRRSLSFLARAEKVTIEMSRAGPGPEEHPLYEGDANFCVPTGASVTAKVTVPQDHVLFFLSDGGLIQSNTGTIQHDGPTHFFYSYEAPIAGRRPLEIVEEGPFRVFAPANKVEQAREVARLSAGPFQAAIDEAGLDVPFGKLRVLYVVQTEFDWEAGHYNGHGYVTVKEETLNPDATEGYPLAAVKVVVHEAFHAASFPYGKGAVDDTVSWWLEGTARNSERHVDAAMPNATRHCEKTSTEVKCWDFDDRIKRADLETGYQSTFSFDTRWEPSLTQSEDTRRFYYQYSEYVVATWKERHGVDAYARAWDTIEDAFERDEGCPCDEGWIEKVLNSAAGGEDAQLFRPYADLRSGQPDAFEAKIKPFVKDEEALQRELDAQAGPLGGLGVPLPSWIVVIAIGAAACVLALRTRRA